MAADGRITYERSVLKFEGAYRPQDINYVSWVVETVLLAKPTVLTLDFSDCTAAFPNSMLPLIASMAKLRLMEYTIYAVLPKNSNTKEWFNRNNWAHYLSPFQYSPSDDVSDRHLAVKQYTTIEEHSSILKDIIDIILRTVESPRSPIAALQWAISEVMDNVIMHSNSNAGGFVQLAIFQNTKKMAFCVADSGQGILASLRESYKALQSDKTAIEMAVRAGVTRNNDIGQGNGLSGSLHLALQTGGRFGIISGKAELLWQYREAEPIVFLDKQRFYGTVVDFQMPYDAEIDVAGILNASTNSPTFSNADYRPVDMIETGYLSDDGKSIRLRLADETIGFGTRLGGEQMRRKCRNLMNAEPDVPMILDWNGIQVIASSYADEFVGKMFVEMGPISFMSRIRNVNMMPFVKTLLDKAIMQRMRQIMPRFEE
ncbi:MAG TPA: hypothetical protein VGJ05_17420 [Fimbriiglobus sp.]|jgi:anti-sigma regulatory factor (Ser/Thr protein kinase)